MIGGIQAIQSLRRRQALKLGWAPYPIPKKMPDGKTKPVWVYVGHSDGRWDELIKHYLRYGV